MTVKESLFLLWRCGARDGWKVEGAEGKREGRKGVTKVRKKDRRTEGQKDRRKEAHLGIFLLNRPA